MLKYTSIMFVTLCFNLIMIVLAMVTNSLAILAVSASVCMMVWAVSTFLVLTGRIKP